MVGIRGTDFETEYIAGKPFPGFPQCLRYTDVGVYQGLVEVSNPTSAQPAAVRESAGYETTLPCELPPANPSTFGLAQLEAHVFTRAEATEPARTFFGSHPRIPARRGDPRACSP